MESLCSSETTMTNPKSLLAKGLLERQKGTRVVRPAKVWGNCGEFRSVKSKGVRASVPTERLEWNANLVAARQTIPYAAGAEDRSLSLPSSSPQSTRPGHLLL